MRHFESGWISDLRLALRGARRHPGTALAIVLTLALGIGFGTAIFSVVHAVLLSPLPYADPGRLVMVWNELRTTGLRRLPLSASQLLELRRLEPFAGVEAVWATRRTLTGEDPRQVSVGLVTPELFGLLGATPLAGRLLAAGDELDPAAPPIVISHSLWRDRFGGDPGVVGRTVRLDAAAATVVGVLPASFRLLLPEDSGVPAQVEVYAPLPWALSELPPEQYFLRIVGRLQPGVTVAAARSAAVAAATRLRETYPAFAAGGVHLDVEGLQDDAVQAVRPLFLAASAAAGLFLALMVANVATLLVARTLRQRHEIATRVCLGATRGRLLRHHLVEIGLLTLTGSGIGAVGGVLGAAALWGHRPAGVSRIEAIGVEPAVLVAALGVALLAAAACALVPSRLVSWTDPRRDLGGRDGECGRGSRMRPAMLAGQLAVCSVLLVGAVLLARSSLALGRVDPGFDTGGVLTFKVALSLDRFPADAERARLAREVEAALAALPGVDAAGAGSHLPFDRWANWSESALPEGATEDGALHVDHRAVTDGYFAALGARVVAGRAFDARDGVDGAPVAVIDEVLAARAFPDRPALGRRLRVAAFRGGDFVPVWATVVGVVAPLRDRSPALPSAGQVYLPFAQSPRWELAYAVRTAGDPLAQADAARRAVASVGGGLAVADVRPMATYAGDVTAVPRFLAGLVGLFALVAVLLAAVGLYGVVATSVARRRRELALRLVLGARADNLVGHVLAGALRPCVLALLVGLPVSWAAARLLASLLYGVTPGDPLTFAVVAALLVAVTLAASLAPAWRVRGISPAAALRGE